MDKKDYKTTEAQRRASKKWNEKNKDYRRIKDYKSKGLKFLKENSSKDDLSEFEEVIKKRRKILEKDLFI